MGGILLSREMADPLQNERIGVSLIVRFTRPEIRNPLSVDVLDRLGVILDHVESDESIKRVIFTGEGDAFASGADLREIASVTANDAKDFARRGQDLMAKIAALPKMTVAAINGYCFGGALDLALTCKRRIAAPGAVFSHPGVGLGIITGWGGTQRLPRLVGEAKALEIFLTTKRIYADDALLIGLIDQIANDPVAESLAGKWTADSS